MTCPLPRLLWVWDEAKNHNGNSNNDFIRRLPEYHSSVKANSKIGDQISISFFGMLSPFRGLAEILLIGLLNRKIKVRIKGRGFAPWRIWRPFKFKILRYKKWTDNPIVFIFSVGVSFCINFLKYLPNIELDTKPFSTEHELDLAIASSNTIFYGAKLPLSSGIALKSLAAGVPVVWFGEHGEAFNFLSKNYPYGKIKPREILIPNFIYNKIKEIEDFKPSEVFPWSDYKQEVCSISTII